jgi:hypothetical protein
MIHRHLFSSETRAVLSLLRFDFSKKRTSYSLALFKTPLLDQDWLLMLRAFQDRLRCYLIGKGVHFPFLFSLQRT